MKKIFILIVFLVFVYSGVEARPHSYNNYHHSSSESRPVYLIGTDKHMTEQKFPGCDKHYVETETIINYYSDGTRRTYSNSTIFNSDGSVLVADCQSVKHVIYNNNHYFIVKKYKEGYKIIDSSANVLTKRNYSRMEEVSSNRILVKADKKYGIIDLQENIVIPVKYQKLEMKGDNIFLAKLNGYYGIIEINNNELIKCECEKIKQVYDVFILKKYGKYGLADMYGYTILEPKYDKIKKLDEYILVKNNDKYGVYDYKGEKVSDIQYKKIRLERNCLQGQIENNNWVKIEQKYYPTIE